MGIANGSRGSGNIDLTTDIILSDVYNLERAFKLEMRGTEVSDVDAGARTLGAGGIAPDGDEAQQSWKKREQSHAVT